MAPTTTFIVWPSGPIGMVVVHAFGVPLTGVQLLDQPRNEPAGVAVKVTVLPNGKSDWQTFPQYIGVGLLTTRPWLAPPPSFTTVSVGTVGPESGTNVRAAVPTTAVPVGPTALAVMFVVPVTPFVVAKPEESMVATCETLDAQVTGGDVVEVKNAVPGLPPKVPIARNCAVSPIAFSVWSAGMIVIDWRLESIVFVTVIAAWAVTPLVS